MSGRRFFSRIMGGEGGEDETRIYSAEELGASRRSPERQEPKEEPYGFTAERAAEIIDDLPPEVPRESALRIVRGTLEAAGVRVEDLERSTRVREAKLNSEIELAQSRQRELRERTDEVVRSLEEEIRKAREARDTGVSTEEQRVSRASAGLHGVRRVRAFFGFPEVEEETGEIEVGEAGDPEADTSGDETHILEPLDTSADETQVLRRSGLRSDPDRPAGTTDER
ncbi:hypothetical protein BH24ACT19_BH24ACT19_04200 [soil metagenome]